MAERDNDVDARASGPQALRRVRRPGAGVGARMPCRWGGLVLLIGLRLMVPAWSADESTLKETLGKVRSNAESKAVEDLIEKLKGTGRTSPPTPTAPASPTAASGAPAVATPSAPAAGVPSPAEPPAQTISAGRSAPPVN